MPISSAFLDNYTVTHANFLARSERFELPTPRFEVWCSIQLSYERFAKTHATAQGSSAVLNHARAELNRHCIATSTYCGVEPGPHRGFGSDWQPSTRRSPAAWTAYSRPCDLEDTRAVDTRTTMT